MKKSERLIRNTVAGLVALIVLYVGASHLYAGNNHPTTAAEPATLTDFSAIQIEGNLSLDVVQGAAYSVDFLPSGPSRGSFFATVRGDKLVLRGLRTPSASRVRVALPALSRLNADGVAELSVSGFSGATVSLELNTIAQVTLRNNGIRRWRIHADGVRDLRIDRATLGGGARFDLAGHAALTVID
jgi:Putative auto-transporter adhesin, head GIN domain